MGQSTEVNLVREDSQRKEYWFDPILECLKSAVPGNRYEKIGVVLAPFIIRYNTKNTEFVNFSTEKAGKTTKEYISFLESILKDPYNEDAGFALGKHFETGRGEKFQNIRNIAREMYFPKCLENSDNRRRLVEYYTQFLERVQPDKKTIEQVNKALRTCISIKSEKIQPEEDMTPHVSAAKALYCAILVCACSVAKFCPGEDPDRILRTMLPKYDFLSYPRQNTLAAHSEEISIFIRVVESYPASTMERFSAMTTLWKQTKNYYAGWELYQQYYAGDVLHNTAGTQTWQLVCNSEAANKILEKLHGTDHSVAVDFCKGEGNSIPYLPNMLEGIRNDLQRGNKLTDNQMNILKGALNDSDEAKFLYYTAVQDTNVKPDGIFLDDLLRYRNAELWDLLVDLERNSTQDLLAGAQHGSLNCLCRYLESPESAETEDSICELLLLANQKQDVSYFKVIQDFYLRKVGEKDPHMSDQHRDNIRLLGLGLRRLCRRIGEAEGQNKLEEGQKKLEEWLRNFEDKAKTKVKEFTVDDLLPFRCTVGQ